MSSDTIALMLGSLYIGSLLYASENNKEHYGNDQQQRIADMKARFQQNQNQSPNYPIGPQFYQQRQAAVNQAMLAQGQIAQGQGQGRTVPLNMYAGPPGDIPQSQANINLTTSGDQLLDYQLYQEAVNAATPTLQQLNSISGEEQMQPISNTQGPYSMIGPSGPDLFNSEYQMVNLGNPRAEAISDCAQNAPTFVATSLLPKPSVPGQDSWDVGAPQDILANQNFLSATQQLGTDTVLSSKRGKYYDLRNNIPNPIAVVSPWMNSSITPDLERRPLDAFIPTSGLYSNYPAGTNVNPTYVGMTN